MAEGSHGAELGFELDPTGDPGTFSVLKEFSTDVMVKFTRDVHEFLSHNRKMKGAVPGILALDPLTVDIGYEVDEPTHINLKEKQLSTPPPRFKVYIRGPFGGVDTDEVVFSCFLSQWQDSMPVNGLRAGQLIFQPDGEYLKVDGIEYVT